MVAGPTKEKGRSQKGADREHHEKKTNACNGGVKKNGRNAGTGNGPGKKNMTKIKQKRATDPSAETKHVGGKKRKTNGQIWERRRRKKKGKHRVGRVTYDEL